MILEWIKHTVINHKISYLLLLTVIMGAVYSFTSLSEYKFKTVDGERVAERTRHWNGEKGTYTNWDNRFNMHYLTGFIFILCALVPKKSAVDYDALYSYLVFDMVGFYSYKYQGWPEPTSYIIVGFCLTFVAFVGLRIYKMERWKK